MQSVQPVPLLRRATNADAAAALALVTAVLAEYGLRADACHTDADLADFEAHYFARGGDFAVLVDAAGALVGICGLYPLGDGAVELRKMYLAPNLRGRGQGRRLLDWALALYERNGFKPDRAGLHSCRCDTGYSRAL